MGDLDYRQMVIEAIDKYYNDHKYITRSRTTLSAICKDLKNVIKALPITEQTLYGYNIEHLAFIASLLQKENISPEELKYMLTDIRIMMQFVVNDITDTMQREIECQMGDM